MTRRAIACAIALALATSVAVAQQPLEPIKGKYERIKVHGKALEGNLSGDSADRDVSVYLPPGYQTNTTRRYPVVYMLHGFTDSDDKWFGLVKHFVSVPVNYEHALAAGARETILVMPNAFTRFQGSMYSSGPTTGDWELFVARDLVAAIDGRYRTIASRDARGLTGHSMGGYGALRIGMKFPEVFGSVYAMSPCCLALRASADNPAFNRAAAIQSVEAIAKADFATKATLASAAAWSPNPKNPPFYFDLPVKDGAVVPDVAAKWAANSPLALVDQYVSRLRTLRGVAIDVGDQDGSITATSRTLHDVLTAYGLPHEFEVYTGNHINGVARQLETKVFRFFSATLAR